MFLLSSFIFRPSIFLKLCSIQVRIYFKEAMDPPTFQPKSLKKVLTAWFPFHSLFQTNINENNKIKINWWTWSSASLLAHNEKNPTKIQSKHDRHFAELLYLFQVRITRIKQDIIYMNDERWTVVSLSVIINKLFQIKNLQKRK